MFLLPSSSIINPQLSQRPCFLPHQPQTIHPHFHQIPQNNILTPIAINSATIETLNNLSLSSSPDEFNIEILRHAATLNVARLPRSHATPRDRVQGFLIVLWILRKRCAPPILWDAYCYSFGLAGDIHLYRNSTNASELISSTLQTQQRRTNFFHSLGSRMDTFFRCSGTKHQSCLLGF